MGMFDSVMVECPKCTCEIEFQSKAGECTLRAYKEDNIPNAIAVDIEGHVQECFKCGTKLRAVLIMKPRLVFREED